MSLYHFSLLFALLLFVSTCCCGAALAALLLAALGLIILVVIIIRVLAALAATALVSASVFTTAILILVILVVFLDDLKVVLKSQRDKLVLEFVAHVEIVVHLLGNVLLSTFLVVFFFLGRLFLSFSEFLLVGHDNSLEEVEETLLLDDLGDGLSWLALLCLLLLLDLLLGHILAIDPIDLSALALLNDVLSCQNEALLKLSVLEVLVLFKREDEVEAVASGVELALDVLKVSEEGSILLLDQACNTTVVKHGAHPEPWNTKRCVLNVLNITAGNLNLLEVLVVKELGAGFILGNEVSRGLLLTNEDSLALLVNLLIKSVVLELKLTVEFLILIIDCSLIILS